MKKDKQKMVRVNSQIMEALEARGWSAQRLVDWAIEQLVDVKTDVKVKKASAS